MVTDPRSKVPTRQRVGMCRMVQVCVQGFSLREALC